MFILDIQKGTEYQCQTWTNDPLFKLALQTQLSAIHCFDENTNFQFIVYNSITTSG